MKRIISKKTISEKIISMLNSISDAAVKFTVKSLELVAFASAMLAVYCIVMNSRGDFGLREIRLVRASLEYIVCSAALAPSFGLLIDLAAKKSNKPD